MTVAPPPDRDAALLRAAPRPQPRRKRYAQRALEQTLAGRQIGGVTPAARALLQVAIHRGAGATRVGE